MRKGFTLLELIIVLVLMTIMAGFVIPSYQKSMQKSKEREAYLKLVTIHGANEIYKAKFGKYLDGTLDLTGINAGLTLELSSDLEFAYLSPDGGLTYQCTATYTDGGSPVASLRVQNGSVGSSNPCCSAGTCATEVPDC